MTTFEFTDFARPGVFDTTVATMNPKSFFPEGLHQSRCWTKYPLVCEGRRLSFKDPTLEMGLGPDIGHCAPPGCGELRLEIRCHLPASADE